MAGLFEQLIQNTKSKLPAEWAAYLQPGTAQYEAAVLLNSQGKLPKIVIGKTAQESYNAEFSPKDNTVTINPKTKSNDLYNAIAHELTHALNTVMKDQVFSWRDTGKQPTGIDAQFLDAWRKLHPGDSKLKSFQYPDQSYNEYRNSLTEAPAFAVGRMADPRQSLTRSEYWQSSPAGEHVDATLAQEQAILRDMYGRTQQPQQQQQEPTSPWWKDPFGFTIK